MPSHRSKVLPIVLLIATSLGISAHGARGQQLLADFNGTGFDYVWGGFNQVPGVSSVHLYDPVDGWGGAVFNAPGTWDFSGLADDRLTVDVSGNADNGVDWFQIEMYDRGIDGIANNADDRSGKWRFQDDFVTGVPRHLVAATNMASPQPGVGDWQNLDLSAIDRWQVIGQFGWTNPFDLTFDNVAITDEVPPPYDGWAPDAPWRTEAAARIDAYRKSDLNINVVDAKGQPIPGAQVAVAMLAHEFGFGSAVKAWRLQGNDPTNAEYQQKITELFNEATLTNNLKWKAWEGEFGTNFTHEGAVNAIDWLASQGIQVRGHNLVWPGINHLPQSIVDMLDNPPLDPLEQQTLRDAITAHIADVAGYSGVKGALVDWDVVNEPRDNHDVMDALGEGDLAMVHWFQEAAAADPNAKRYLNEHKVISSGGAADTASQQEYFDTLEFLINNGAPIDGIGIQGHFSPQSLTGPEQLWDIFDRFAALGLDMKITEFSFATADEQLQADYMRDFMTAVFAYEGIDAFIQWGFWEGDTAADSAMYRDDWSIKPNGQTYLDLVFDQWWTNEDLLTDEAGGTSLRGFKGDYEVTVTVGDFSQVYSVVLSDGGLVLNLVVPEPSAFALLLIGSFLAAGVRHR